MAATGAANENARPRGRFRMLLVLGGIALLFAVLAGAALMRQAQELAPKFTAQPMFPGLAARADRIVEIGITNKSGGFHIRLVKDKGWVVAERNSFPADANAVKAMVAGMANLEAVEPKTSRADWLDLLGLGAPDKGGEATRISLADASGKPIADLLVGHTQETADAEGRNDLYVRRTGENQAWRARGFLSAKPAIGDWLDKNVMDVTRDRIATTSVTPAVGPNYAVVRTAKDQPDFQLLDLPKGRELAYGGVADTVASAIVGFTFDDVAAASDVDFAKATALTSRTFDGLIVNVKVAAKGGAQWASVSAQAATNEKMAEAKAINARTVGWAFKLPQFKADMFLSTRDSLLKPPPGAAPAPGAANGPPPQFSFPGAP